MHIAVCTESTDPCWVNFQHNGTLLGITLTINELNADVPPAALDQRFNIGTQRSEAAWLYSASK